MSECGGEDFNRRFQFLPQIWGQAGVRQCRNGGWRKNTQTRPQEQKNALKEAKPTPTGEEWGTVQHALSGDSIALATIFARDRKRLYKSAYALLRNKEDAEDALQEGLLSAYVNLASFQGRSEFSTWLTRIVINAALKNRRRQRARLHACPQENPADGALGLDGQAVDTRPDPEEICSLLETRRILHKGIGLLSPFLRSAICCRDVNQLSTPEAAKAAGITISAMKSRTARARQQMASFLDATGVRI
jgi:RNA polymerase sigma-70 factor, ECF subfamily